MIRYSLAKNTLNKIAAEYIATVKQSQKTGLGEILDYMTAEGSGLTRPQALAYFEKLMQAFEYFIEERGGLSIPMFQIRTTITGVFSHKDDTFDPDRHQIHLRISPGVRLQKLQNRLTVKKEKRPEIIPIPVLLMDTNSQSINGQVSPGGIAMLQGRKLKLDPGDPRQGIFFIPENNPTTQIRVDIYAQIKAIEILFLIPQLQPGNYQVIVQTVMQNHVAIRTGVLNSIITVS